MSEIRQIIINPVYPTGNDPWVTRDPDTGRYYYCYSGGDGVFVNQLADNTHITTEGGRKVYTAPKDTMYSKEYWAPELHKLGGRWYIYVAADGGNNHDHRMYVLECAGDDPMSDFRMAGKIFDETDKWAIDGTVVLIGGEMYFVWSGWEGDVNVAQNLYIAHMSSPTQIDSERTMISRPEFDWEKRGSTPENGLPTINEGPEALYGWDATYIVYSASGSWCDDYCLGMLKYKGGDPLRADSWLKYDRPVFGKTSFCFGPGHCSFVKDPGGDTWIVYHGNLVSGTGWRGRSVWTQPVSWDGGMPVFGAPIGPGEI